MRPVPHPTDNPDVLNRFEATLELVPRIAGQLMRTLKGIVELDDLLSYGRTGLLEAARRFDPSRGVPFRAYAAIRVRGSMLDGVRTLAPMTRRTFQRIHGLQAMHRVAEGALQDAYAPGTGAVTPQQADQMLSEHLANMATAMAIGMVATAAVGEDGEFIAEAPGASPEQATSRAELRAILLGVIDELPPQEAELVRRHYMDGERFDQVALDLGLSKSWASRLHTRAIARLSRRLRSMKVSG